MCDRERGRDARLVTVMFLQSCYSRGDTHEVSAHKHINHSGTEQKSNEGERNGRHKHLSIITCSLAACTVLGRTQSIS